MLLCSIDHVAAGLDFLLSPFLDVDLELLYPLLSKVEMMHGIEHHLFFELSVLHVECLHHNWESLISSA